MAIKCAWASIDERGKTTGGKAGDQTKKEIKIGTWYQFGQNVILRPKTTATANKIASNAKAIANNDNIGYDQSNRKSLYNAWKEYGITKSPVGIKTKCETDCSAMVAACMISAGAKVSPDCWTGNLRAAAVKTEKFNVLKDSKYLTSDAYLKKGDIILNERAHVIVALESGSKVTVKKTKSTGTSKTATTKNAKRKTGKVVARSGVNVRAKASKTSKRMGGLGYGSKVTCYASKKEGSRTWWAITSAKNRWACAKEGSATFIK